MNGLLVLLRPRYDLGGPMTEKGSDVLRRYRGIEGRVWPLGEVAAFPLKYGLAAVDCLPDVEAYARQAPVGVDIVYISDMAGAVHPPAGWRLLGVDIGFYESEYNHFSSIYNEFIWSDQPVLLAHVCRLNENLLFPNKSAAEDALRDRAKLLSEGADLEDCGVAMEPIAVYAPGS